MQASLLAASIANLGVCSGGLSISGGTLDTFTADATKAITTTQVPEPGAAILLALGVLLMSSLVRRRG
jgi:hypothetical protein